MIYTCDVCKQESTVSTIFDVDNLFRKNMMNVKKAYKTNPCEGIYDSDKDSYCSLVEWEEFKKNYNKYIDKVIYDGFEIDLMQEESTGVKKLFSLFCPLLDIIMNGKVLLCDELEAGLHESLVFELVRLFMEWESDNFPQIFFTTHETGL